MEGHTDAKPYATMSNYGNWELSADRANAARRLIQQNGVRQDQVTQVRGYADQKLRKPDAPLDPSNRRISLIVHYLDTPEGKKQDFSELTGGIRQPARLHSETTSLRCNGASAALMVRSREKSYLSLAREKPPVAFICP